MQSSRHNLGIALVQLNVCDNKEENNANAIRMIREAVQQHKPKLVVLPECFNTPHGKRQCYERNAENIPNGETSTCLSNLAKELGIYLIAGSMPERDQKNKTILYNTTTAFSPIGNLIAKHRQIQLANMNVPNEVMLNETEFLTGGNTLNTLEIDGVKIGLGICCDMLYPELATLYQKNGCDLLIYTIAFPPMLGEMQAELLTKARAADNRIFVASASPSKNTKLDCTAYGHSIIADPLGRTLVKADDREQILYHEIDVADLQRYRNQIPLTPVKRTDVYDTVYKQ